MARAQRGADRGSPIPEDREIPHKIAFVIEEAHLRSLDHIFSSRSLSVSWIVRLANGSTLHPPNIASLLTIPNTDEKRVVSIKAKTHYGQNPEISIAMNAESDYEPLNVSLSGDTETLPAPAEELETWVQSIRQKYSLWAFSDAWMSLSLVVVLFILYLLVRNILWHRYSQVSPSSASLVAVFGGTALATMPYPARWMRKRLFPVGIFAFGGGAQFLRTVRSRQRFLSMGAILSAVWPYCGE
jgi:hypothetical protein